jgi:hypothetical protein
MNVVIQVSDEDRPRAWGFLVRHSSGTALPNNTFIISEDAARALRSAGIAFTEISREGLGVVPGGAVAGERI